MKHYFIKTYGCQMNYADSDRIAAQLENEGYASTNDFRCADVIVFNSCVVRQGSEDSVYGWGRKIGELKIKNEKCSTESKISSLKANKLKIIVAGCLVGSETSDRKKRITIEKLKKKMPWVDEFWPIGKIGFKERGRLSHGSSASVPIMEGCNNFCSYCVVPYTRGEERSRPIEEIVCEVKRLVKSGVQEITLLGQNVNSYKKSSNIKVQNSKLKVEIEKLGKKYRNDFALLLMLLNDIPELETIKFLASHPKDMTDDLIGAIAVCEKVEKYVHFPIQAGDDDVLRKMNRGYTTAQYKRLVDKIREKIPGVRVGTDVIVGFPGETKKQFENTANVFRDICFDNAFIALYSPRVGTAAYQFADDVQKEEKKRRHKVLTDIVKECKRHERK